MSRSLALVSAAAVALYLPTARYGFVQDDRAVIARSPAAHSIGAAVRAFDDPYWPLPAGGEFYRPLTILTFAVDWTLSGGRPGWFHLMNALWHGLAAVLVVLVVARWLPERAAMAAGLVFALHPVHVEGVANIVSRAELLATVGILGAVLAARRGRWAAAVLCAALAMLSKEHGVVTGVVILLDDWLRPPGARRYPAGVYVALGATTVAYLGLWAAVGRAATADVATPFLGAGSFGRLAVALPAILRAAGLLVWPADLSVDYGPQVIPVGAGLSLAAAGGALVVLGVPAAAWYYRRRAPVVAFALLLAALAYLPTSNLLFPSGIVLAERNLYLPVFAVAAMVGWGVVWAGARWDGRRAGAVLAVFVLALAARSSLRLPSWRDNRSFLVTLLEEHPESARGHASAAAVLAGMGDTAGARREYALADALYAGDPHLDGAHAFFLLGVGDTAAAAPLAERARRVLPRQRMALRVQFLLARGRGDRARALALADSAGRWFPWERQWYLGFIH